MERFLPHPFSSHTYETGPLLIICRLTTGPDVRAVADLVIVCDCIYYEASLHLVQTILGLSKQDTTVILAYERRPDKLQLYEEFFSALEKYFSSQELITKTVGATNTNEIHLFQLSLLE